MAKAGRPSIFNDEVCNEICIRIACGESLASICRDGKMPGYRTVIMWLGDPTKEKFLQDYTRAREEQGDADADAVADVGRRVLSGELDPQAARVAIDALKWTAGKRRPKKYGDRLDLNHSGSIDTMSEKDVDARLAVLLRKAGIASTDGAQGEDQEAGEA